MIRVLVELTHKNKTYKKKKKIIHTHKNKTYKKTKIIHNG